MADGSNHEIISVSLAYRLADTKYIGQATIDDAAAQLTQVMGHVNLLDLRRAMSQDATPAKLVTAFSKSEWTDEAVIGNAIAKQVLNFDSLGKPYPDEVEPLKYAEGLSTPQTADYGVTTKHLDAAPGLNAGRPMLFKI